MKKRLLVLVYFFMLTFSFYGGERYYFSNLTVRDGLSQISVLCAFQDSQGFMWFGTRNGLNKFDGYSFEAFYNDPFDSTSISNNQILCISEDPNKNLWIGTRHGLNKFDLKTRKAKRYFQDEDRQEHNYEFVFALSWDKRGRLWMGTEKGLAVYDPETDKISSFNPDGIFTNNPVYALVKSQEDNVLYLGTRYSGLLEFNTETLSYKMYKFKEDESNSNINDVRCLYVDKNLQLWVGTFGGGINILKNVGGEKKLVRYHANLTSENIRCFAESPSGEILIGTSNGMNILDPKTGNVEYYNVSDSERGNLTHFSVYSILYDKTNTLWVGTYSGGIDYYNRYGNRFKSYFPMINRKVTRSIYSHILEYNSYLYIATEGDGLLEYDLQKETYKFYNLTSEYGISYDKNIIKSLCLDGDVIYCGTSTGSIYSFDAKTKSFSLYYRESRKKMKSNVIYEIKKDKNDGSLIVASVGGSGFIKVFPNGRIQSDFPVVGKEDFVFRSALCFLEIEKNVFLVGTRYDGLYRYDYENHFLTNYKKTHGKPDTDVLDKQINQIYKDSYGRIWLATFGGGLIHFDPQKEIFTTYGVDEGLLDNNVCMILETPDKHFWITTSSGISDFDPRTKIFKNYTHSDGININEFTPQSGLLSKNGQIYFCGDNGFVSFDPAKVSPNPFIPPIVISNFYINNLKIVPGGKDGILKGCISSENEVVLKYDQSNIAIEYAALSYVSPYKNQYAYKLENFDKEWNEVKNRRIAYYTNIPVGTYTFRVIGSNNDGIWNDVGASIKIVILPPFWKTWWAYCLYFIIIFLVLCFVYYYFREKQNLQNDIQIKKMEAKAQQEFHEERNKLFTNFSHELRSPLTLILSPLEEMADVSELPVKWKNRLEIMRSNARRLLRLVNNLMDFTKKESGTMRLKAAEGNIVRFSEEMYLLFTELAISRNITFRFNPSRRDIAIWFDRDLMEKVFYNFLSNAFKNTPNGGNVEIRLSVKTVSELRKMNSERVRRLPENISFLLIEVQDSGVGIPSGELMKIFAPFYQVSQNEHAGSGTGLGLSLSKSIIEMHHGVVWAENVNPSGALFRCVLPTGKELFKEEEICENYRSSEDVSHYTVEIPREELMVSHSKKKKYTILVVEDNNDVRHYMVSHLIELYNVIACSNAMEGIEKAIHFLPDLILSDLMMSQMDGLEMCHKLKADMRTSHIPIIMITARTTAKDIQVGYESGVDDYITKPFNTQVLLSRIDNLLQSREKLKDIYGKRFSLKSFGVETNSLDEKFMQKLYEIMYENFSNPDLNLDSFCKEIGMSRSNLYRKIKQITNLSPNEFVRNFRLEMAAKLLKESKMSVSEVYVAVGFNSHAYFSNCFKALYGMSPSDYAIQNE